MILVPDQRVRLSSRQLLNLSHSLCVSGSVSCLASTRPWTQRSRHDARGKQWHHHCQRAVNIGRRPVLWSVRVSTRTVTSKWTANRSRDLKVRGLDYPHPLFVHVEWLICPTLLGFFCRRIFHQLKLLFVNAAENRVYLTLNIWCVFGRLLLSMFSPQTDVFMFDHTS